MHPEYQKRLKEHQERDHFYQKYEKVDPEEPNQQSLSPESPRGVKLAE